MAEISKGRVLQIDKTLALIEDTETGSLKRSVYIPKRLRLSVGDDILYAYFNDLTGVAVEKIGGDG